jgi:voltage-gated potassium channel
VLFATLLVSMVIGSGGTALWLLGEGRWSLGESLYMAIVTVSTVGFGELPEIDHVRFARSVTVVIIVAGLGTVAFFQSSMTAAIVEGAIGHAWRRNRMKKKIEGLSGHVVVAGIGSTGRHVVEELIATETPFVVIERNHEHVDRLEIELGSRQILWVHGDATEDHTLIEAGIVRARGVIAALTNDRDNLFVTLSARALNSRARIVSKVVESEAIPKMTRAGADATVSPNIIGGRRMASELIRPDVVEFIDQMLRDKDRNLRLEEVLIPQGSPYAGHALRDVPIRKQTNVLVVAVRDSSREFKYNPGPDTVLEADTTLIVLGETTDIVTLRGLVGGEPSPISIRTRLRPSDRAALHRRRMPRAS